MNLIAWLLRLVFFLAILWFALKNTMPVTVRLTETLRFDEVPLVAVMGACLLLGMLLGALALAPRLYRLHRRAAAGQPATAVAAGAHDETVRADRLAAAARRAGAVEDFEATEAGRPAPRR